MRKFKDVDELVNELKPDYPVYCIRPESIKKSTEFFMDSGLIQYTGFTGLSVLTSSLTSLNFRISCVPLLFTQKVF